MAKVAICEKVDALIAAHKAATDAKTELKSQVSELQSQIITLISQKEELQASVDAANLAVTKIDAQLGIQS